MAPQFQHCVFVKLFAEFSALSGLTVYLECLDLVSTNESYISLPMKYESNISNFFFKWKFMLVVVFKFFRFEKISESSIS